MKTVNVLRLLIVVQILFLAAGASYAFVEPLELKAFENGSSDILTPRNLLYAGGSTVLLGLLIAGWIGLGCLKRWARPTFLAAVVLSTALAALVPAFHSGPAAAAGTASNIVEGLILGLVYFSDLRLSFAGPAVSPAG